MNLARRTACAAVLFAAPVLAQIPIPPHASVYNGLSRGFNFTANTNFFIVQLDLPPDAMQAGDTASYLVRVNGTQVLHSIGNAGAITTNIQVNTGDVVDVIGNWSPASPGSASAHNSYGSSAPYATTIEGVAHTLNRMGWQWDIGDPAFQGSPLTPSSGSIGRVLVYTSPPSGLFARYSATPTRGASPLQVQFTDNSFSSDPGGVTSWAWDLDGDTVIDSTQQNPTFTYTNCGSYTVSLTVTDGSHAPHTLTQPNYIVTDEVDADFTYQVLAPGTVQFTDTTVPAATTWAWDFDGDMVIDSTVQNPVHVYPPNTGLVNVSLTASRLCGPTNTETKGVIPELALQTTLAGGNGLSGSGSGNVFDLTVTNPLGITITQIVVVPWATTTTAGPVTCDVWMTDEPGGYLANHNNAAVWRLVATGSGTAQVSTSTAPVPAPMTLSQRFYIPPGSYSMAIHMNGCGIVYTTGNGSNQNYGNADLSIAAGVGKGSPFSSSANNPRVWNGILFYDVCSIGGLSGYGFMAQGCAGSTGVSTLTASSLPALGSTLNVAVDNLPANVAIMLLGFSNTNSVFGPLPLDLTPFGAPGCTANVSDNATALLLGAAGTANWSLTIPNNPTFLCTRLFNQALVLDPGFNALGGVTSDAAAMMIGN